MLRLVLVAALAASTTAFAPPKSAVAPKSVNINPPLTKALELRGGGIISKVLAAQGAHGVLDEQHS